MMLFKYYKRWVEKFRKGKTLFTTLSFSILVASCATSQSTSEDVPVYGINPVPIYNPVIQNQPGFRSGDSAQYTPDTRYSNPKASKKKKKKAVAKKTKSSKKKVTIKGKKKSKKAAKRKVASTKASKRRVVPRRTTGVAVVSQQGKRIAEASSSMDNLNAMGEYKLGDTLLLRATPISKGQVSVNIEGSRIDSVIPCKFSGVGKLSNGSMAITDKSNNRLNFSFSRNSVNVQGDTLNESCGGEYIQK